MIVLAMYSFHHHSKFSVFPQHITSIFNRYTHESAIFNPLRAKRPGATDPGEDIDQYIEELISSSQNCDFCDFKL